jgi:hypothetical protein
MSSKQRVAGSNPAGRTLISTIFVYLFHERTQTMGLGLLPELLSLMSWIGTPFLLMIDMAVRRPLVGVPVADARSAERVV